MIDARRRDPERYHDIGLLLEHIVYTVYLINGGSNTLSQLNTEPGYVNVMNRMHLICESEFEDYYMVLLKRYHRIAQRENTNYI